MTKSSKDGGLCPSTPQKEDLSHPESECGLEPIKIEGWILVVVFLALGLVVFAQFFFRYVLNLPLGWSEEAARYLLIFVTFIGTVVAVQKNSHIFVEYFYRFVPTPMGRFMTLTIDLVRIVFFVWLCWQTKFLAGMAMQNMSAIPLPKSVIYWVVFGCFAMAAFRSAVLTWQHIRKPDTSKLVQVRIEALQKEETHD